MPKNYGFISDKIRGLIHGADYNPDQWLHVEGILEEDIRYMRQAGCNAMAVNIFGWSACEPQEGEYRFDWLDRVIDRLYEAGIYAILATPSGARPAWMSQKYPEVLRVNRAGQRHLHGGRHNHCYTSPVYRQKVQTINEQLALRYGQHPGLILWHVSNEYGGECYCDLCQEAFRDFLKARYGTLDALNQAWWAAFWSHTYSDWSQIEPPMAHGENSVHGLNLEWQRFRTHQTLDFYLAECEPLRRLTPNMPITTNFHDYINIDGSPDYWALAPHVDIISWDNYPLWHGERPQAIEAGRRAFIHDINRSFKGGRPFMMMESSPGATNWQPVAKLRRPGMHALSSMQAIAHGSDTVQYFQWRKSLGSSEKFHAAVLDHYVTDKNRMFQEVCELGRVMAQMPGIAGTTVAPEVAIIYDWENLWALNDASGPRQQRKDYFETVQSHYQAFWQQGIPCDVISSQCEMSGYRLVIAPMLYMLKPEAAAHIRAFVQQGGTLVTTYWSGIVDQSDLCFTTGRPGPLRDVCGIWSEELDALYDGQSNQVRVTADGLPFSASYQAEVFCDLVHLEGAQALAVYGDDFYQGRPALTLHYFGQGQAYYIAFRSYDGFLNDFYRLLAADLALRRAFPAELPEGVTATIREDERQQYIFLQNYEARPCLLRWTGGAYQDVLTQQRLQGNLELTGYGWRVLKPE